MEKETLSGWYKHPRTRDLMANKEVAGYQVFPTLNTDLSLLIREFKSSSNLIAMPGYDTIRLQNLDCFQSRWLYTSTPNRISHKTHIQPQ